MTRAAWIFFHGAAGVSGVLFFVAVGFSVASYGVAPVFGRAAGSAFWEGAISRGEIAIVRSSPVAPVERSGKWFEFRDPPPDLPANAARVFPGRQVSFAGFLFASRRLPNAIQTVVLFPIFVVAALFAPLPLADVMLIRRRRRRERRLAAGLCVRCGYDLRASPDRCPECGATPAAVNSV